MSKNNPFENLKVEEAPVYLVNEHEKSKGHFRIHIAYSFSICEKIGLNNLYRRRYNLENTIEQNQNIIHQMKPVYTFWSEKQIKQPIYCKEEDPGQKTEKYGCKF